MKILGFEIRRQEDEQQDQAPLSFAAPTNDDGAITVGTALGGSYSVMLDMEGSAKSEAELINKYRSMFLHAEIQQGVEEITNEAINVDSFDKVVSIVLDDVEDLSQKTKDKITDEFEEILRLLDFSNASYDTFQRWYVDGRLNYHVIIDEKNLKDGIKELRYLDPRKIRLVREIDNDVVDEKTQVSMKRVRKEYYVYAENGFGAIQANKVGMSSSSKDVMGFRIAKDSVVRITSGLMNETNSLVLSYLHRSIKPLNQLKMLEDATVIYTLTRAPERRVFYIDVGNLPKAKAEQYLHDMMARHKNKLQYDSTTGEISDSRKFMCYALDTKIPLLDGRTLELRELIEEHKAGKKNWVYSCDPKTGKFYPGPVSWAGITKQNAEVVRITFDNGKSVVCTPDHKFPVWDKGFVEAQHLTPEDSIIPGYRREAEITSGGNPYEQIYMNETGKWEYTHRAVEEWKKTVGLSETFIFNEENANKKKSVIHHKDINRYNNNPENLVMMNHKDHLALHRAGSVKYTVGILDLVDECAMNGMSRADTIDYVNTVEDIMSEWRLLNSGEYLKERSADTLLFTGKDMSRITSNSEFKNWKAWVNFYDTRERETNGRWKRGEVQKGSAEHYAKISAAHKGNVYSSKTWKITSPTGETEIIENLSKFCRDHELNLNRSNIKTDTGSWGWKAEQLRNHRIISVEKLDDKITVGSISIDNDETYHSHHTYLLDAGVYTKNTMTEDFWFPRREGNRATEIEPLAGGTSLQDNENLSYFQNKLFKSLGVPLARLQPETMFTLGRGNETTREEVKFGKFIRRLRARFSILFDKTLEKQLILKGILSPEEWDDIKDKIRYDFMKDNHFEELKEAEVMRERAGTARELQDYIGNYFSHEWIMKNVFMMSDEEIKEMKKQIDAEKKDGLHDDGMEDDRGDRGGYDGNPYDNGNAQDKEDDAPHPNEQEPDDEADESLQIINNKNKR